jgi:hypothetical protein
MSSPISRIRLLPILQNPNINGDAHPPTYRVNFNETAESSLVTLVKFVEEIPTPIATRESKTRTSNHICGEIVSQSISVHDR